MADSVLLDSARDGSLGKSMNLQQGKRPANLLGGRTSAPAALFLGCLCLSGVTGCKTGTTAKNEDPLFGIKPPQVAPVPPANASNPSGAPQASWNSVPPPPAATSAGSTAALASLPGARPLRINEAAPGRAATFPTVQPIPRDVPQNPALLTTGAWTQATPGQKGSRQTDAAPVLTADQALAQLTAKGALSHKVETLADGRVRVTAVLSDRMSAGQLRHVEAEAATVSEAVGRLLMNRD